VCSSVHKRGLAEFIWLALSRGYRGTKAEHDAGRFHLAQRAPVANEKFCGLSVDVDESNPERPDFGAFTIPTASDPSSDIGKRYVVVARSGLRLREGPGTQFEIIGTLRNGQVVYARFDHRRMGSRGCGG